MSADNGIYILKTTDFTAVTDVGNESILDGVTAYRVAHAMAIDNFDYYKHSEPSEFESYLSDVWGNSPVFYNRKDALVYAGELQEEIGYTEYGISTIDASDSGFPF